MVNLKTKSWNIRTVLLGWVVADDRNCSLTVPITFHTQIQERRQGDRNSHDRTHCFHNLAITSEAATELTALSVILSICIT